MSLDKAGGTLVKTNASGFAFYPLIAARESNMSLAKLAWLSQGIAKRLLAGAHEILGYSVAHEKTEEFLRASITFLACYFPLDDLRLCSLETLANLDDLRGDARHLSALDLLVLQCYAGIKCVQDSDGAYSWKETVFKGPLGWCSPAVAPYIRYRQNPFEVRERIVACVLRICRFYKKHPDVFEDCMRSFVCKDDYTSLDGSTLVSEDSA